MQLNVLISSFLLRATYLKDKKVAETGTRIEEGEAVQPKMTMETNHAIWLATKGAGFGKMQWRFISIIQKGSVLVLKFQEYQNFPERPGNASTLGEAVKILEGSDTGSDSSNIQRRSQGGVRSCHGSCQVHS